MRCQRAQQWMAAAVDGEVSPRRRRALDGHLASCAACRGELAATERMLTALEALPMEAPVSASLEQATLRRVRLAAADEAERAPGSRWKATLPFPVFALATVAVLVLAVGIVWRAGEVAGPAGPAARPTPKPVAEAAAPRPKGAPRVAAAPPPSEPPAKLAEVPDLFMDLPILRNMDKLRHFEAIQTTTLDDEPPAPDGQEPPSNG
jgi:anti-sigma factor RsiW